MPIRKVSVEAIRTAGLGRQILGTAKSSIRKSSKKEIKPRSFKKGGPY